MDESNDHDNYDTSSLLIEDSMLSTTDNPYDPFTQFDLWYAYDLEAGYNSCSLLARIVKTSDDLSDVDQALAIEKAIDEIVLINALGLHIKVKPQTFVKRVVSFASVED